MPNTRKLYRQGNSIVVALPSYALDHMGLDAGSTVVVTLSPCRTLTLSPLSHPHTTREQTASLHSPSALSSGTSGA